MTPPAKTPEERLAAGAAAVKRLRGDVEWTPEMIAKVVLEAADAPPKPKWPTDESMTALRERAGCCMIPPLHDGEIPRTSRLWDGVGAALLANSIIKAAVALRDAGPSSCPDRSAERVVDAVNEAGL